MSWLVPWIVVLIWGSILLGSLCLGDSFYPALCNVLSGIGATLLLMGLALVGQMLTGWPPEPFFDPTTFKGPAPWLVGCVLIVYGTVVIALGVVLRQLLRHMR